MIEKSLEIAKIIHHQKQSAPSRGATADYPRLLLCCENSFSVIVGVNVFKLHPGDALFIPAHTFLSAYNFAPNSICLSLTLDEKTDLLEGKGPILSQAPAALFECLLRWFDDPAVVPLTEALLLRLFSESIESVSIKAKGDVSQFLAAINLLEEHLEDAPSVEKLAAALKLSLSTLKRLFARFAGIGVHEYLIDRRISKAKQILKGGCSVTETAQICGFANQAYFSAAFKKTTGCSPKEYLSKDQNTSLTSKKQPKKAPSKPSVKREMPNYLL